MDPYAAEIDRNSSSADLQVRLRGDPSVLSLSTCEFRGFYGDSLKCCPSQASLAPSDSGFGSYEGMSQSSSSSSLLTFEAPATKQRDDNTTTSAEKQSAVSWPDVPVDAPKRSPKNAAAPRLTQFLGHMMWLIVGVFAFFRSLLLRLRLETNNQAQERIEQRHFVPLYDHWESLFTKYIYRRLRDILNRPIAGRPGPTTELKDRFSRDLNWTFEYTGTTTNVINLGSYNYLGFADNEHCSNIATQSVEQYGIGLCSSAHEIGHNQLHVDLERMVAKFLGVEDAYCIPMGFGTNTMNIPALVDSDALVLSDELNHASLIMGCRMSGAVTKVFKHNDTHDCERKLQQALRHGNARKGGRPYSKILIIIEGLYSMEGTIAHLKDFVRLKKKYKAYLFLDEAHSIGSIGRTGRGVSEYWGVDPNDVDILMGTFTKSFSAAGGYVAGRKNVIDQIRIYSYGAYGATMAPPIAAQIIAAIQVLMGADGTDDGARRLAQLRVNTRHFRTRLRAAGFLLYGNDDSPVVPTLVYFPSKVAELSRQLLRRRIGIVVVGFPATPIATERARFCLSSGHTIEQLDYVIDCLIDEADRICIRYCKPEPDDQGTGQDCDLDNDDDTTNTNTLRSHDKNRVVLFD